METPRKPQRLRNAPVIDRLMFRTIVDPDGCWLWQGSTNGKGYGHIRSDMGGPIVAVHRVAYEHHHGPIPAGLEIDHLCKVRNCVRPDHLEAVTHAENVARTDRRATHCKHGHPFSPDNTKLDKRGMQTCRTCGRERMRAWRAARRSA